MASYPHQTHDWVSGLCWDWLSLPCSCLRIGDAHWCPLPSEILLLYNFLFPVKGNKAFNTLMGPETVGPQRRTGKLFEVKIYLCGPQMTTLLFENVLLSFPGHAGKVVPWQMGTPKPAEVTERKEGIKVKVFCSPYYKSVSS